MVIKIKLSESIGLQLKEFRTQYKVKSKEIAELLGKSPAYISKLEKGQIQQIDKKELVKISNYISKSQDGYNLFCEKIAKQANQEELDNNLWLLNFDLLERKIPVTEDVVHIIRDKMDELNFTAEQLSEYVNKNEDLSTEFLEEHAIDLDLVEKNVWIQYREADSIEYPHGLIFLNYSVDRIQRFIEGKILKCEYMFPYAMLYHLRKEAYKRRGDEYDDKLIANCKEDAEGLLLQNKFYSLSIKLKMGAQIKSTEEYSKILSEFDMENMKYISQLLQNISFLSQYDVEYTNQKLEKIVNNFEKNDPSFVLAFMSLSLVGIEELHSSYKREFLNKVEELIEEYANKGTIEKEIEKY